jgi:signal transduction histidine kinase
MSLVGESKGADLQTALAEVDWTGAACRPVDPDILRRQSGRASQRITALGEMTGGIAHDVRNVLAVIESSLSLAERDPGDLEKLRFCLASAHEGVRRGLNLTSRLLAFAKQQELEPHEESANDLLKKLEMFLQYGAGPGLCVRFDLEPELPKCLIDPTQFNAAVLNLVVNARDAMPAGGIVEVSTKVITTEGEPTRSSVCVRVKDDGMGMTPAVARRIFDPYFTTKGETGTGLGLPQVCAFMKLVGGEVCVASEVGVGTIIDLLFPLPGHSPSAASRTQVDRWMNEGGAPSEWMPASQSGAQ